MDIAAWLQDLELQRYVSAFRDGEILSKLTAEDLIGIGVTSVGVAAGHIARPSKARGKGHPGVVTEKRGRGTRYASTPDPTLAKCKPMSAEGRGRRGGVGAADDIVSRRARSDRSSVTVKKKRSAATALLTLGGCMPVCVWCSWKRRRSSAVAVSGDRPMKAANDRTLRM